MNSMDRLLWGLTALTVLLGAAVVYRAHHQGDAPSRVVVVPIPASSSPSAGDISTRAFEAQRAGIDPRRQLLEDWGVNKWRAPPKPMVLASPPPGVRCYGETAVEVKGSAYTQAVDADGRPMKCVAGKVLLPGR